MTRKRFFDNIFSRGEAGPPAGGSGTGGSLEALREENVRLTRALEELSMLNDLAREIGASHNADAIMDRIIRRTLRAVNAEQAVITLVSEHASDPIRTLVRAMVTSAEHEQFHLNQNLLGWMHLNKKPLMTNSPRTDERFRGITWDPSIESILCVPLMVKSKLIGVLTAFNKKGTKKFTEEDQRLIAIIAMQSAQVVENARLGEEEQAYIRMQEEVRLASRIQIDLLPQEAPTLPGYDIAGHSIPAQQVGGDYFDFIPLGNEKRLAICLGDVSGKGLPASLLMANLQATLRGQTASDLSPRETLVRSNQLLFRSTDPEKFATLFYGILDAETHELVFANAGHENPYLYAQNGAPQRLATGGTVLGIVDQYPFEEERVAIRPGDLLVIFSDGITEAFNANDEQFGEKRLTETLEANRDASADELVGRIVTAVREFAGNTPQADDLTLVAVRRLAE